MSSPATGTTGPTRGRRAAARTPRRLSGTSLAGLALLALAAAGLVVVGSVEAAPEQAQPVSRAAVDRVTAACLTTGETRAATVATLATPLPRAEDGGSLATGTTGSDLGATDPEPRGTLQRLDVPATSRDAAGALVVDASEQAAVGRVTSLWATNRATAAVAVQTCASPQARWWFTGGAAALDHRSTLVLANVDPGPAVVDVRVHGIEGLVDSVGTRGITIRPGEVRAVDLVDVAPQADDLAVHVLASRGRVVAGLADRLATSPGSAPGTEWVPAQAAPARRLRLTPLPRRADRRTLVVANPGNREAMVEVAVAGESGPFVPTDLAQLRVPPGSVTTADLASAVGAETASLVLRSPVPVTATVRSTRGADVAYAAPAPRLRGTGAVVVPDRLEPTVQLTAGEAGGTARVAAYSADGEGLETTTLAVRPGTTGTWTPGSGTDYLVVTRVEGALFGGVSLAGPAGLAQAVLAPVPKTVRRPVVVPVIR